MLRDQENGENMGKGDKVVRSMEKLLGEKRVRKVGLSNPEKKAE